MCILASSEQLYEVLSPIEPISLISRFEAPTSLSVTSSVLLQAKPLSSAEPSMIHDDKLFQSMAKLLQLRIARVVPTWYSQSRELVLCDVPILALKDKW